MIRKFLLLIFFTLICACEFTTALWEDCYVEDFKQFLVSSDARYIAFLGKRFHYVFEDTDGLLKKLFELDQKKLIEIDSQASRLEIDKFDNINGYIVLKTFDMDLSWSDSLVLKENGFEKREENERVMFKKLPLAGKRYRAATDHNLYYSLLSDEYQIKIYRSKTVFGEVEKLALTPITIIADTIFLFGEIALVPFRE